MRIRRGPLPGPPLPGLLGLVLLAAACGQAGSAPGGSDATVVVKHSQFSPTRLEVRAGQAVRWVFDDAAIPHDVTALDRAFQSGVRTGGEFVHRFSEPGVYAYVCSLHFGMGAAVEVR